MTDPASSGVATGNSSGNQTMGPPNISNNGTANTNHPGLSPIRSSTPIVLLKRKRGKSCHSQRFRLIIDIATHALSNQALSHAIHAAPANGPVRNPTRTRRAVSNVLAARAFAFGRKGTSVDAWRGVNGDSRMMAKIGAGEAWASTDRSRPTQCAGKARQSWSSMRIRRWKRDAKEE